MGVAGSHHNNFLKSSLLLPQKSFIHYDLFEKPKFSQSIELVKEYPQLDWTSCWNHFKFPFNLCYHWSQTTIAVILNLWLLIQILFVFKWKPSIDIENCELMLVKMSDHMSKQSCLTNTSFSHYNNRYVEPHSLGDKTHFEKVVNVHYVAFFTVDSIVFVAWDIHQNLWSYLFPLFWISFLYSGYVNCLKKIIYRPCSYLIN